MLQLLYKDIRVTRLYLLLFFPVVLASYFFHVNNLDIFMTIIIGYLILLFYYDYHNQVYKFIGSLPVKRTQIVLARYLFLILLLIGAFTYIGIIDYFVLHHLNFLGDFRNQTINDVLKNFTITAILIAIYTPIFYLVKNFIYGITVFMIVHFLLVFTYNMILFNDFITIDDKLLSTLFTIINIQPVAILLIISAVSLFISFLISVRISYKKDIL
ncbi:ABC-2 transporter permease [Ornithinibacillus sp. 179-J 7C1 HS]|uniref:ABC-2 transporter permease n=1 Tax=Ornithinibacillus sp. 179-J 7C1 HS TaxID=3142384 RepID=UPI00399F77D6